MISYHVSGTILDIFNQPVIGATIYLTGNDPFRSYTAATNLQGEWSIYLPEGWNGFASAAADGWNFEPSSIEVEALTAESGGIDFVGSTTQNYFAVTRRDTLEAGTPGRTQAWVMEVEVVEAEGVEPELFLLRRHVLDPNDPDNTPADYFVAICSPNDIEEFPINAPYRAPSPLYRVSSLTLDFRSILDLEETWEDMQSDFRELRRTLKAMQVFGSAETDVYVFGD